MNRKIQDLVENIRIPSIARVAKILGKQPSGNTIIFPSHDLDVNHESSHCTWYSTGSDPQFIMQYGSGVMKKGWYMLEIKIHAPTPIGRAKLYIGNNVEEMEAGSLPLVYSSGRSAKRLIYLKEAVNQIRFDPLETKGHFQIDKLKLTRVTEHFAKVRMSRKLSVKHPDYRGEPSQNIMKTLQVSALKNGCSVLEQLRNNYDEVFQSQKVEYSAEFSAHHCSYRDWVKKYELDCMPSIQKMEDDIEALNKQPVFSVVLPTYNTDLELLKKCLDSVITQSYPFWELCIADDCSDDESVKELLRTYAKTEDRMKLEFRKENGHISASSNTALKMATGDYVVLLDHDDELAVNALYHVAMQIDETPNARLIYSDEDKIDSNNERCEPNFKPDWNPDLLYSQNYICHLAVYDTALIKSVGGFRVGVEGSQDHDLLLRCTDGLEDNEIVHIPKVLYHWRKIAQSTASDDSAKGYTTQSGIKALKDYFKDRVPGAQVKQGMLPNTYRVNYSVGSKAPLVSLLIPTRDQVEILSLCISSILEKTDYSNYEIIIIDNQSSEPETHEYFKKVSKDKRVSVVAYNKPFNYSAINNFGMKKARGTIIGLVNNDIEVINSEWLSEMVSHANRPEIGCVGAKLYYANDQIQHAGVILGLGGVAGHSHKHADRDSLGYLRRLKVVQNMSAVTAACLLVKKEIFNEVHGLNESDLPVAFNDVDFCLKVREAGYRNLWTPYAELYHHESISRGFEDTPEKKARFSGEVAYMKNTWGEQLLNDPAYNPNLSKDTEDFSIAA